MIEIILCKLRWHISLLSPALVGIWSIPACTHTSRQVPALRSGAFLTNCEKTAYFATNISIHPFSEIFFISHACHFWLISLFSLIPPFPPPPPPAHFLLSQSVCICQQFFVWLFYIICLVHIQTIFIALLNAARRAQRNGVFEGTHLTVWRVLI